MGNDKDEKRKEEKSPSDSLLAKLAKYDELIDEELLDKTDLSKNEEVRNVLRKLFARMDREKGELKKENKDLVQQCLKAINEKQIERNKRLRLQIPLTCRCYIDKIEDICGGQLPFLPQDIIKGKKTRKVEILKRAALWKSYFTNHENSPYIRDFLAELKIHYEEYKMEYPTVTYDMFLNECAQAIGTAHKQVSERISHGMDGTGRKVKSLKKFDKQTDQFLTIFYNAVVGQDYSDSDSD